MRIVILRSKSDQTGEGAIVAIPRGSDMCAAAAIERWVAAATFTDGAAFREITRHGRIGGRLTTRSVAWIVKKRVYEASLAEGQNAEKAREIAARVSSHSLRAGFATAAAAAGVQAIDIARQTRHRSLSMVQTCVREAELFTRNPVKALGL